MCPTLCPRSPLAGCGVAEGRDLSTRVSGETLVGGGCGGRGREGRVVREGGGRGGGRGWRRWWWDFLSPQLVRLFVGQLSLHSPVDRSKQNVNQRHTYAAPYARSTRDRRNGDKQAHQRALTCRRHTDKYRHKWTIAERAQDKYFQTARHVGRFTRRQEDSEIRRRKQTYGQIKR